MLENRKNIVEGVWLKCEDLEGITFKLKTYSGEEVWKRACRELMCIKDSFSKSKYLGKMDDNLMFKEISDALDCPIDLIDNAVKYCCCKRANYTYNINADDYMKVRQSRNKTAKMRLYYEFFVQHKFF